MVKTAGPTETRLQARMEDQEEKIDGLEQKIQELTHTVSQMQQTIAEMQRMCLSEKKEQNLFVCKVKLYSFNGDNPHGWLNKAELYFRLNQTPPAMKLVVAQIFMEGAAENWYTNIQKNYPQITWSEFKEKLVARFTGSESPFEKLLRLKQQGSVDEYLEKFEMFAAMVPQLVDEQYIALFECGLKDEIKYWVRMFDVNRETTSVEAITSLARRAEVRLKSRNGDERSRRVYSEIIGD